MSTKFEQAIDKLEDAQTDDYGILQAAELETVMADASALIETLEEYIAVTQVLEDLGQATLDPSLKSDAAKASSSLNEFQLLMQQVLAKFVT
jgi:dihydroneopterin aldolase